MTPQERQQEFLTKLKALLAEYKAEITIEDKGRDYMSDPQMVVEFDFLEELFEEHGTGLTPEIVLGRYVDGKTK